MKSVAALICFVAFCCQAQQKDEFRIVNGQLYNINRSTNWVSLPLMKGAQLPMRVVKVTSQGALLQYYWPTVRKEDERIIEEYLVKNRPDDKTLTTGTKIYRIRAMRVGTVSIDDKTLGQYDYGNPK